MRQSPEEFDSIRQGFQHTDLTFYDAWIRYFSLGGTATYGQLRAFLDNEGPLEKAEQRVLAHSLNEVFIDEGRDHPVPYPGP
jgi:hypothetical protein